MAYDRNVPFDELSRTEKGERVRWLHEAEDRGELVRTEQELLERQLWLDDMEENLRQSDRKIAEHNLKKDLEKQESEAWSIGCLGVYFVSGFLGFGAYALGTWLEIPINGERLFWVWIGATVVISIVVTRKDTERAREDYERKLEELARTFDVPVPPPAPVNDYREYLRSPHWQSTRTAALELAGNRCQVCGTHDGQLEVHHNTYKNLGREQPKDLIVLCRPCHRKFHEGGRMPVS